MSTVEDIERVLKGFLWNQGDMARGKAKIAWKTICKPKMKGGLGFKDLGTWNEVLLTKHIYNIVANKETLWVQWIHMVKVKKRSVWEIDVESNDSWIWKSLIGLREKVRNHIEHVIGNGENISVCGYGKMNGRTNSLTFVVLEFLILLNITNEKDKAVWRCRNGSIKKFSVKQVWEDYKKEMSDVRWGKLDWFTQCIPSHMFVKITGTDIPNDWLAIVDTMANKFKNNSIKSVLSKIVFGAAVYYEWQERNKRQFSNERRNVDELSEIIINTARLRLSSIKVIRTTYVKNVEKDWDVKFKVCRSPTPKMF
ncbi:hypothetical protein Tco_0785412 [Tanacetum coccineum]